MKSTWFSKPAHYEFSKLLQDAARGRHDLWSVFTDWLDVTYLSLSQAVHLFTHGGELDQTKEDEFARIMERYDRPENFSSAIGVVVNALEVEQYDFIGSVAGELRMLDKAFKGQCFTPRPLCELTALMTLGEIDPDPDHRLTICEPACGGGAMAIAAANLLKERGFFPWNYWIDCTDIDRKMWQACYIQLTLCGVPAVVRWGNSLSLEEHRADVTLIGAMHPLRRRSELPPLDGVAADREESVQLPAAFAQKSFLEAA